MLRSSQLSKILEYLSVDRCSHPESYVAGSPVEIGLRIPHGGQQLSLRAGFSHFLLRSDPVYEKFDGPCEISTEPLFDYAEPSIATLMPTDIISQLSYQPIYFKMINNNIEI